MKTSFRAFMAGLALGRAGAWLRRGARAGALLLASMALAHGSGAPPADSVEADAQEYTRLVMQHDRLLFEINMRRVDAAREAELPAVRAQGESIQARYASGGAQAAQAARFRARIQELSRDVVAPAVLGWITDAFPEVEAVRSAFPDELRCGAALRVLEQTLSAKVGEPAPPAAEAKLARYRETRAALGSRAAAEELSWTLAFQVEVLQRFAPLYAVEADDALRGERYEAEKRDKEARVFRYYQGLGLLVLLVPWLFLLRGQRAGSAPGQSHDANDPFQLPPELRRVRVFRKQFDVRLDCGLVTDKSHTVRTVTYSAFTPGEVRVASGIVTQLPGAWSRSTVEYHDYTYTFETPDGRTLRPTFHSYPSDIEVGQTMGMVSAGGEVLLVCNNTAGRTLTLATNSRMRGWLPWLASVALAFAGFWSVQRFVVERGPLADDWRFGYMVVSLTLLAAIATAIEVGLIKGQVERLRTRQFHARWGPKLRAFVEARTPHLERHFAGRGPEPSGGA